MAPPVEWPAKCARAMPRRSMRVRTSAAICSTEYSMREWLLRPVPRVIMNDDAKVAGEGLDLGGPERAEAGEAGHEEKRGALAALLVVEVAVAQGDGGHGASARGVVHAKRALDGHDVLRPLEGRGSGRPRLARPPDGLEELLEARRRHHPEHHELVF